MTLLEKLAVIYMLVIMRANRMQEQRDQDNGMHASVSQLATSKQSKEKSVIL